MNQMLRIQQIAIDLWEADQQALGASEKSAKKLGAALNKVKATMPHGGYTPWLKENGIDRNRANYCMRVAAGKQTTAKAKKPSVVTLKNGVLVRWNDKLFHVTDSFEQGTDELSEDHRLILHVQNAPEPALVVPTPIPEGAVDLKTLKGMIRQVEIALAQRDGKFACEFMLLESTADTLRLVAVDSNHMAISERPANLGEFSVRLSVWDCRDAPAATSQIKKMAVEYITRTEIEKLKYKGGGAFPNYRKVIPLNHDGWTEVTVNTERLVGVLKRVPEDQACLGDPRSAIFSVDAEGRLTVLADGKNGCGESWSLRAHIVGSSFTIRMDGKLLLPFLKQVKGNVTFYVKDANKVVVFYAHDGYRFLQVPMKPADKPAPVDQVQEKLEANFKSATAATAASIA